MAKKSLSSLVLRAEKDRSSVPILMEGLLRAIGHPYFASLIRSKLVEKLIANVETSDLQVVVGKLDHLILNPQIEDDGEATARRLTIANVLVDLLRSTSIQKEWKVTEDSPELRILSIFFFYANFSSGSATSRAGKMPTPPFSDNTRKLFNAKLSSCLTVILTQSKDSVKFFVHLLKVANTLQTKPGSDGIESLCSVVASSEIRKLHKNWDLMGRTDLDASGGEAVKALDLLIAVTIIQAYGDEEDAVNLLRDLAECAVNLKNNEKEKLAESIVEILLTLISKPSAFARKLVARIFPACTSSITDAGLATILKARHFINTREFNVTNLNRFSIRKKAWKVKLSCLKELMKFWRVE